MTNWHILTGEYPPQPGGVSDYTQLVARRLVEAGDVVHVWSPPCSHTSDTDYGVHVHRLPDRFGSRSLREVSKALSEGTGRQRLLVQYVPHAYGWKALNIPFCIWLWRRRKQSVWVVFHEVVFPLNKKQSPRHNALGLGTRLMASLVVRAAERLFVSTESWNPIVKSLGSGDTPITWLPIPSNMPVANEPDTVASLRSQYAPGDKFLIGHFGTYGPLITDVLVPTLLNVLREGDDRVVILLGRGGEIVRDELVKRNHELATRVFAPGELSPLELSNHLQTVDVMVQPFPDGISTRRTSAMACLQHGLATVSTSGDLTESFWAETNAVLLAPVGDVRAIAKAVDRFENEAGERTRIGACAKNLYDSRFDVRHTIDALRGDPS